jgi:GNAT superfamily N-acetyltransferase
MVDVRPIGPDDGDLVSRLLERSWGSTSVAGHGVLFDASTLPGIVVTIDATVPGRGVRTALLNAVESAARTAGASRLWLITTNDNTRALRFYQRHGFDLVALHRDAVMRSRAELKPSIPLEVDGITVRHELELERMLR